MGYSCYGLIFYLLAPGQYHHADVLTTLHLFTPLHQIWCSLPTRGQIILAIIFIHPHFPFPLHITPTIIQHKITHELYS